MAINGDGVEAATGCQGGRICHSSERGNPVALTLMDPRFRGDDILGCCLEQRVGGVGIFAADAAAFLRKYGCEGGGFGVDYVFTFHA